MKESCWSKIDHYISHGLFPKCTLDVVFNKEKHVLGRLCSRGHDYCGTGQTVRSSKHRNCIICMKMNAYVWRAENLDRARSNDKNQTDSGQSKRRKQMARENALRFRSKPLHGLYVIAKSIKERCKEKNIPCNIDYEDIVQIFSDQKGLCYWYGAELELYGPARHPNKPSVDRIIPALGYVKGNVVIASNLANRGRSDCPADEYAKILKYFAESYCKRS